MEEHLQSSPKLSYPIDSGDAKYVSGLSTILVATIQEAKDRISQIEYIFCSQLFPNFQSKSKTLVKIYSEARKAAEDGWKEKERDLLLQVERLQLEKQQAFEEKEALKLEKIKTLGDQEEKSNLLMRIKSQQLIIDELENNLNQKSMEIDKGMELHNRLVQLVQTKASLVVDKGKQLKRHEEKADAFLSNVSSLEKGIEELKEELMGKTTVVSEGKDFKENLLKKMEVQALEIMNNEQLLTDHAKEKTLLLTKLKQMEECIGELRRELKKKTEVVEKGGKLVEELLQQVERNGLEIVEKKEMLEECEKDKKMLLVKVNQLEEKVNQLQLSLRGMNIEGTKGRDSYEMLLQQMATKESELLAMKKKRRDVVERYKSLKSQYNFLCKKLGCIEEEMHPQNTLGNGSDSFKHHQDAKRSPDLEDENLNTFAIARGTNKVKNEADDSMEDARGDKPVQISRFHSPTSSVTTAPKCPFSAKTVLITGRKRSASSWRGTRSNKCIDGPDPHDDFLDTPLENVRGDLNKVTKEEDRNIPIQVPGEICPDSSDDETQDMNVGPIPQKRQMPVPMDSKKGFKYVEPVRKKAERESLKGVECKQCKKFYDAVLPNNEGKESNGNNQNFRCEHHDGVSRHRYRYVPPLTPDGFWNIGFDSEM
ncbi:Gamma response1 putative isoform 1 [Tripterygium wilfordii]|uniref:Gamma response1 putative isoform 1 n=1 Tax=Tripterygium wilfordii TaxID=458696 RepID=A0A7J7CQT8_TRIWF|nr:protein gamma response 1-like [Tripterygium wilfordii]KAF5736421.1 Gamma response1 putative isoform 1 [Tripterygium wilfordii]